MLSFRTRENNWNLQDVLLVNWMKSNLLWHGLWIHRSVRSKWKIAYTAKCWKWRKITPKDRRPRIIGHQIFFQISTMPPRKQPSMKNYSSNRHGHGQGLVTFLQKDILRAIKHVRKKKQSLKMILQYDISSDDLASSGGPPI